ncbi:siderophore-interacting protein [Brachybacterium hainanense]|uniref:Siderophore-interacting protein n=1 Tax=Brachybacterium hainanense TaxID=1541174 RepID=A0ABV6RDC9_9MICO
MFDASSTPAPAAAAESTTQARPARPNRPQAVLEVISKERITPQMMRVRLGGEGLADLSPNDFTDSYVKLLIAAPGSGLTPPYDLDALRAESPELLPSRRTYTVRRWDLEAGFIDIDFVLHGTGEDAGVAARWADEAIPGDLVAASGAGGAYAPRPEVGFHLIVGDHSALPAIVRAIEALPPRARGVALIQLQQDRDRQRIEAPEGVEVRWLIGENELLVTALEQLDLPAGEDLQVFAHGERGIIKRVRRELVTVRSIPKDRISISAYWALGRVEDQFQAEKREPVGRIDD